MSRSRNTAKIQVKSDAIFDINSIRVIQRKPKQGDIHPLSKKEIKNIIERIPSKYIYKLPKVELLARKSEPGNPWGSYWSSESKIVLYSHPIKIEDGVDFSLNLAFASNRSFSLLADLIEENGKEYAYWAKWKLQLFYLEVFAHEIGHHYYRVTKFQKKMPYEKYHEILAENYKDEVLSFIDLNEKFFKNRSENELFNEKLDEFIEIISRNEASDR